VKLFTTEQERRLLINGEFNALRLARNEEPRDFRPVVKLFCPWGSAVWLLTELDPKDPSLAFGLYHVGLCSPHLGTVSVDELAAVRGPGGGVIQRELRFKARMSLRAYADAARSARWIVS
jgi:hypothetical protein